MHHTGKVGGICFPRPLPEGVAISGLDVAVGLDEGLPLLDHGSDLVCGEAEAVEVGEHILALDLLRDEAELAERPLSIRFTLEISEGNLEDTTLQALRGNLCKEYQ